MGLRTWIIVILIILVLGLWFYAEATKDAVRALGGVTAGITGRAVDKIGDSGNSEINGLNEEGSG